MDLSPALTTLKNEANEIRTKIKAIAAHVKDLKDAVVSCDDFPRLVEPGEPDKSETIANVMLAYRHLEDASMRLGKTIQAIDGGTSVYDRATTVGA